MRLSRFARALPQHQTEGDAWPTWVPAGSRRRLDPLVRLATAAVDRLQQQGPPLAQDTAIIVATSYGAVESTFRFANSIATYGDSGGSPTPFTTSVHNSCAAALGELLGLRGPTTTISHGPAGPLIALRFAAGLVAGGRAPAVLVVAGEKHNDWSRNVVGTLSGCPWTIGDGLIATLVEQGDGSGRELSFGYRAADITVDGGTLTAADALLLANLPGKKCSTPTLLGSWWPGCGLAGMNWRDQQSLLISEVEDGRLEHLWLSGYRD
jgi:3-oxoacyl-[acyl-carrier-protein] synthase III